VKGSLFHAGTSFSARTSNFLDGTADFQERINPRVFKAGKRGCPILARALMIDEIHETLAGIVAEFHHHKHQIGSSFQNEGAPINRLTVFGSPFFKKSAASLRQLERQSSKT
jgi:hypothetical protein